MDPHFEIKGGLALTVNEDRFSQREEDHDLQFRYGVAIPAKNQKHAYGVSVLLRFDESGRYAIVEDQFSISQRESPVLSWTTFLRAGLRSPFGSRFWTTSFGVEAAIRPFPTRHPDFHIYGATLLQFGHEPARIRMETGIGWDFPVE